MDSIIRRKVDTLDYDGLTPARRLRVVCRHRSVEGVAGIAIDLFLQRMERVASTPFPRVHHQHEVVLAAVFGSGYEVDDAGFLKHRTDSSSLLVPVEARRDADLSIEARLSGVLSNGDAALAVKRMVLVFLAASVARLAGFDLHSLYLALLVLG